MVEEEGNLRKLQHWILCWRKLNRAKRIERGELIDEEEEVQGEESNVPVLGSGPERRKVRPIMSTEQYPNPPHVVHSFLGGLSLHLNHLIAQRAANYDWPFGTLPFGLFGSNLDIRDLETYPRTYSGQF